MPGEHQCKPQAFVYANGKNLSTECPISTALYPCTMYLRVQLITHFWNINIYIYIYNIYVQLPLSEGILGTRVYLLISWTIDYDLVIAEVIANARRETHFHV